MGKNELAAGSESRSEGESGRDAGKFERLGVAPFRVTPYRYTNRQSSVGSPQSQSPVLTPRRERGCSVRLQPDHQWTPHPTHKV